ncbi:hypothetical protein [Paludibaculum fermentans]|uniref:hypothetical protein n=1 Tax=Paludibaculum fermentans TaxID=1473598 RepID=UPI003EBD833E
MSDELPGNELKAIWHNQPTEPSTMTLKLMRSKVRDLQAKTRRQALGALAGPLAAALVYAFGMRQFPRLAHVMHPLFLIALGWSLLGIYFLNHEMWSPAMPGDAGLSTGLEFCRAELERRRKLLSRLLLWSFGPILLTLGTFLLALALSGAAGKGLFPNGLPFMALLVIWILAYFARRAKEQRILQREIEELDDLARSTP